MFRCLVVPQRAFTLPSCLPPRLCAHQCWCPPAAARSISRSTAAAGGREDREGWAGAQAGPMPAKPCIEGMLAGGRQAWDIRCLTSRQAGTLPAASGGSWHAASVAAPGSPPAPNIHPCPEAADGKGKLLIVAGAGGRSAPAAASQHKQSGRQAGTQAGRDAQRACDTIMCACHSLHVWCWLRVPHLSSRRQVYTFDSATNVIMRVLATAPAGATSAL